MLEQSVRRHVQAVPPSAAEVRVSNDSMHMQLVMCFVVLAVQETCGGSVLTSNEAGYRQLTILVNSNDSRGPISAMLETTLG
jgi:hypothetical protein